jgi:hypothetical protein
MSPRQRRRFLRRGRTVLRTMTPVQREIFPWASTTRTAIYSPRAPRTRAMAMVKPAASPLTGKQRYGEPRSTCSAAKGRHSDCHPLPRRVRQRGRRSLARLAVPAFLAKPRSRSYRRH